MKTTYLLNKIQPDGTVALSIATSAEWIAVVYANKQLPRDRQRHFILDYIVNGDESDCIVIEAPFEEYLKWDRERKAASRNRKAGQIFQHLSLDAPADTSTDTGSLSEMVATDLRIEASVCDSIWMDELRTALANWKPWGTDMLDIYLYGLQRDCTRALAEKYKVSPQVIRKYKRQFEKFIKKFLEGVSF